MRLQFIFSVVILLCSTKHLNAQIKQGTVSIGLALNMQYTNSEGFTTIPINTYFGLGTSLTAESFIKDNFSIIYGLNWSYGNQHSVFRNYTNFSVSYMEDSRTTNNIYSPILGIRKYWFHPGGRLGLFLSPMAQVRYQISKSVITSTNPNIPPDQKVRERKKETWIVGFTGDIGVCYFIAPHLTLELSTPLVQANVQKNYQSAYINSVLGNISYGIRYYF